MPIIQQTRTIAARPADWIDGITFDQIDPAFGVRSVDLSLTATVGSTIQITSFEAGPATLATTTTGTATLKGWDGAVLLSASALLQQNAELSPNGGSSQALGASASGTSEARYAVGGSNPPDALPLIGTGTVQLPLSATARVSASGPGNLSAVFATTVAASATLQYRVADTITGGSASSSGTASYYSSPNIGVIIGSLEMVWTTPQHVMLGRATTGTTSSLAVTGFDTSLGVLTGISVQVLAAADGGFSAENLGAAPARLSVSQAMTVNLLGPAGTALTQGTAGQHATVELAAFDGVHDSAGPSGTVEALPEDVTSDGFRLLADPSNLAAFTGVRAVALTATRFGGTTIDGPGNLGIATTLHGGADVVVSYRYIPDPARAAAYPFFDTGYYLARNPDVAASGLDPYEHFLATGWREGRVPSAGFDVRDYLAANPDVQAAGIDPLLHYAMFGRAEGRTAFAVSDAPRDRLVDAASYYAWNPDVRAAGADAAAHYATAGWREGRNPDAWFDTRYYLAQNPDVRAAGIDPLRHYEQVGWTEGRDPSLLFSTAKYLDANPDVRAAGIDPLLHFLTNGQAEGRVAFLSGGTAKADPLIPAGYYDQQLGATLLPTGPGAEQQAASSYNSTGWQQGLNPDPWFDTGYYLAHNPDVAAAGIDPLRHYEDFGWREGRDPSASFSTSHYLAAYGDVRAAGFNPLLHFVSTGQAEGRVAFGV